LNVPFFLTWKNISFENTLNMRARIFWIFFYYLVRPMYTSAWKIRSRNDSLERERMTKEEIWTHTHKLFLGYLCWFAWTDLNPGKKYILRRLKSRIDWNLECVDLWIGEMMRVLNRINWKSPTNLEYKQILNTQILNYKCVYLPLFLITKKPTPRVWVCLKCAEMIE